MGERKRQGIASVLSDKSATGESAKTFEAEVGALHTRMHQLRVRQNFLRKLPDNRPVEMMKMTDWITQSCRLHNSASWS